MHLLGRSIRAAACSGGGVVRSSQLLFEKTDERRDSIDTEFESFTVFSRLFIVHTDPMQYVFVMNDVFSLAK